MEGTARHELIRRKFNCFRLLASMSEVVGCGGGWLERALRLAASGRGERQGQAPLLPGIGGGVSPGRVDCGYALAGVLIFHNYKKALFSVCGNSGLPQ